jgi:hypothetical protein
VDGGRWVDLLKVGSGSLLFAGDDLVCWMSLGVVVLGGNKGTVVSKRTSCRGPVWTIVIVTVL